MDAETLIQALHDPSSFVRTEALQQLRDTRSFSPNFLNERLVRAVFSCVSDTQWTVSLASLQALLTFVNVESSSIRSTLEEDFIFEVLKSFCQSRTSVRKTGADLLLSWARIRQERWRLLLQNTLNVLGDDQIDFRIRSECCNFVAQIMDQIPKSENFMDIRASALATLKAASKDMHPAIADAASAALSLIGLSSSPLAISHSQSQFQSQSQSQSQSNSTKIHEFAGEDQALPGRRRVERSPELQNVINDLQNSDQTSWKCRSSLIDKLYYMLSGTMPEDGSSLPSPTMGLDSVMVGDVHQLVSALAPLVHDANFKISLTTMHIMGVIASKYTAQDDNSLLGQLIDILAEKWSDNKVVVRHTVSRTISRIASSGSFPISNVITLLLKRSVSDPLQSPDRSLASWRIREESLNMVIWCLLSVKPLTVDFGTIALAFVQALRDARPKVKFVALEGLAVLHWIRKDAVDAVLSTMHGEEFELVSERLQHQDIPLVTPDGNVEHKLLANNAGPARPDSVADDARNRSRVQSAAGSTSRLPAAVRSFPWENMPSTTSNRIRSVKVSDSLPDQPQLEEKQRFHAFVPVSPLGSSDFPSPKSLSPSRSPMSLSSSQSSKISLWLPGGSVEIVDSTSNGQLFSDTGSLHAQHEEDLFYGRRRGGGASSATRRLAVDDAANDRLSPYDVVEMRASQEDLEDVSVLPRNSDPAVGDRLKLLKQKRRRYGSTTPGLYDATETAAESRGSVSPSFDRGRAGYSDLSDFSERKKESDILFPSIARDRDSAGRDPTVVVEPPSTAATPSAASRRRPRPGSMPSLGDGRDSVVSEDLQQEAITTTPARSFRAATAASSSIAASSSSGTAVASVVSSVSPNRRTAVETAARPMEEITTGDLLPISGNVVTEFNKALELLKSALWSDIYRATNVVRQAVVHHHDNDSLFAVSKLHPLVLTLLSNVDNLRSSISKNSIVCIGEMFRFLSRGSMDAECDFCCRVLFKKTGESNKFIAESAEESLQLIVECVPFSKCSVALLNSSNHKSPGVRFKVAKYMRILLERTVNVSMLDKIVPFVNNCLQEGLSETRQEAKLIIARLMDSCGDEWKRHLPDKDITKWTDALCRLSTSGNFLNQADPGSAVKTVSGNRDAATSRSGFRGKDKETKVSREWDQEMRTVCKTLDSSSLWSDRVELLEQICSRIRTLSSNGGACAATTAIAIFDAVLARVSDGNAKVVATALRSLSCVLGHLDALKNVDSVYARVVPAVANAWKAHGDDCRLVWDTLLHVHDPTSVLAPLLISFESGKVISKTKSDLISSLSPIFPSFSSSSVTKSIIPLLVNGCEDVSCRSAVQQVAVLCAERLGRSAFTDAVSRSTRNESAVVRLRDMVKCT
eukprot:ANDGO_07056.mRNA.1 hypothetical protein